MTPSPVLVGLAPGVTATVRSVVPPGGTVEGFAAPTPDGFVGGVQSFVGEPVLRGAGAPTVKSAALLFESVQPSLLRKAAVVLLSVAVGPEPSEQFVPA